MTDTQAIKDKIDIVGLLGEYIQLKKAGANYKACCPFHHEKTPSFMVHPEKQIWHCFGCGKGGDIFSFIQEIEGLDFPEALKLLAERAGVKIDTFRSEIDKSQRNRIVEINEKAAYFFHRFLLDMGPAKAARDYLARRQLKPETIKEWKVGFIPEQWDLLTQYLLKRGYAVDDLIASGLTIKKENAYVATSADRGAHLRGFYDRFRGRIMFPIWDVHGNVAGFTGRQLVENPEAGGKYVNTPQTPVYDKSRVLYGLNKAKMEIKAKDLVVIVEGQMDVIACHQAGMKNVVAASGTALTPDQVRLLLRYTAHAAMAFDADSAGETAGKRGADVAVEQGMTVRVIRIPPGAGKDADEVIKIDPAVWFGAVDSAQAVMQWYLDNIFKKYDLSDPRQKQKAAEAILIEIARIPYAVERDDWLKKAGDKLGVEMGILREELKRLARLAPVKTGAAAPAGASGPAADPPTRLILLQTEFWSLLLKYPALFGGLAGSLRPEFFSGDFLALYDFVQKEYNTCQAINTDTLRASVARGDEENFIDLLRLRADRDFSDFTEKDAAKEINKIVDNLKDEWSKLRRREIQKAIETAEKAGETERVNGLLKELQSL